MKQTSILIVLLFIVSLGVHSQEAPRTSKLVPGCPKEIEFIKDQINLNDMSYSHLETGIDTLTALFGEFSQQGKKGYWMALLSNDKFLSFTMPRLLKSENSAFPSNIVDIAFDDSFKKISVQITHNTTTNEIEYSWLNNNQKSKIATIVSVEKPIQKGKPFPSIRVTALDGTSISVKDFTGKYVVINWWATTCGPCRQEIPGLNTLVGKYKPNPNVIFLAIAFDKKQELENYLKLKEFKYLQTFCDKETAKIFGESFPKNIIVDPQGIVTYYSEGGNEARYINIDEELKKQLNKR